MSLENLSSDTLRFLGEINEYFELNGEEGYIFLINRHYDEDEQIALVVDGLKTQRDIFNFSLEKRGNVPNVYPSCLKKNGLYTKVYSKTS